jgi:hypothetical protein
MLWYFLIPRITSTNLSTLPLRDALFTSTNCLWHFRVSYHQHHHFFINTITTTNTMESIEEQWNPPSPPDILSDSWTNITDAKKAVKIWILDRGESWAPSSQNNKARLQLYCLLSTCSFYIRIAQQKNGLFGITSYTQHNCPPLTHAKFK